MGQQNDRGRKKTRREKKKRRRRGGESRGERKREMLSPPIWCSYMYSK
jgi:hypothetical protein